MISVVGVFKDATGARNVSDQLERIGIHADRRILLLPGASEDDLAHVPVVSAEQPGMGKVMGGIVGGSLGLGAAAGIAAIPGVGPVTVIGILGLALLGVGGAAAGVKVGDIMDDKFDQGLPVDELFVYEDALHKGRSVVIAMAKDDEQAEEARSVLTRAGAESIDAARDEWWVGLRSAEQVAYHGEQQAAKEAAAWERDEPIYRAGFEAALLPANRGQEYEAIKPMLRDRYPELWDRKAFVRGYERGQEYVRARELREWS